jgi:hypothetical protein
MVEDQCPNGCASIPSGYMNGPLDTGFPAVEASFLCHECGSAWRRAIKVAFGVRTPAESGCNHDWEVTIDEPNGQLSMCNRCGAEKFVEPSKPKAPRSLDGL